MFITVLVIPNVFLLRCRVRGLYHGRLTRRAGFVCRATRQLHLKDGMVHRHGPRHNYCPGSHNIGLLLFSSASSKQAVVIQSNESHSASSEPSDSSSAAISITQTTSNISWFPITQSLIKHILKSARPACASY
jgi:hypothetical protein